MLSDGALFLSEGVDHEHGIAEVAHVAPDQIPCLDHVHL